LALLQEINQLEKTHADELQQQRVEYERHLALLRERVDHEEHLRRSLQEELKALNQNGAARDRSIASSPMLLMTGSGRTTPQLEEMIRAQLQRDFEERVRLMREEHRQELEEEKSATK
jgi:hypothetical protein